MISTILTFSCTSSYVHRMFFSKFWSSGRQNFEFKNLFFLFCPLPVRVVIAFGAWLSTFRILTEYSNITFTFWTNIQPLLFLKLVLILSHVISEIFDRKSYYYAKYWYNYYYIYPEYFTMLHINYRTLLPTLTSHSYVRCSWFVSYPSRVGNIYPR